MTTSSPERAQRLPRDLALIALVIKIGLAAIGIGAQLTLVPNADQSRSFRSNADKRCYHVGNDVVSAFLPIEKKEHLA